MKIVIKNVKIAFPKLFKPEGFNGSEPKYSATLLIPKDSDIAKAVRSTMVEVAKEKWMAKAGDIFKQLEASDKLALRDGDMKADLAGYEGSFYINASNKIKPSVFGLSKERLDEQSGLIYGGAIVNASIDIWAQDNKNFGKRINASLLGIQFAAHSTPFSGAGVSSGDEFEAMVDESPDDFM